MSESSAEIYQAHLDAMSEAFWARDFDMALSLMFFPRYLEADDEIRFVETPEDARPSLQLFRNKLDRLGATAYHRICREATFGTNDNARIEGIHETHALNGTTYVIEPYRSQMTLIRDKGRWVSSGIRAATTNAQNRLFEPTTHKDTRPQA